MTCGWRRVWLWAGVLVLAALPGAAQAPAARLAAVASQATVAPTLTPPDLDAFLGGLVQAQLARDHIAGAVVAVVKDGQPLFEHGYGYADIAARTPVSPQTTLFRPGSVSKLFTWTAVMQLVEQGKLDLDRDVNDYLDFKIPATYAQPITLRELMTHTPGFEDFRRGLYSPAGQPLPELGPYLQVQLPRRIFAPGTTAAYSNYGAALAGYIVERVSGEPFPAYVAEHIFAPLGMAHSSFFQPLPPELAPLAARGYAADWDRPQAYEMIPASPAGGLAASADDMARFMIAQLQLGNFEGNRILQAASARALQTPEAPAVPGLNAMALGFYEQNRNGRHILGHDGDTQWFHSAVHLIPEAQLGLFISYSSPPGAADRDGLWQQFLNRYFPYTPAPLDPVASAATDSAAVAGAYLSSRRSQGNLLAATDLLAETLVTRNPDNTISLSSQPHRTYTEIAPLLFQQSDGQGRLGFRRDESGTWWMVPAPMLAAQRVGWDANVNFNLMVLGVSLVLLLLTLVLSVAAPLVRRQFGRRLVLRRGEGWLRRATWLACLCDLAFITALATLAQRVSRDPFLLDRARLIHAWQVIGAIGVAGTVLAIGYAARLWIEQPREMAWASTASGLVRERRAPLPARHWFWSRLPWTLTALGCCGFTWFVLRWSLLNFNLHV